MSFQSAVSDARSDRLLVFSILGIVALTAVVFGISRFRNGDQPQVPPPAPVVQQQVSVPRQAQPINSYPDNMPQPVNQFVQPEAPPVEAPAATPDPVPDQLPPNRANPRNAKIAFAREITATN